MRPAPFGGHVGPLTPAHAGELADFTCRSFREPWSDLIEERIREDLADALRDEDVKAIGVWIEGRLSGLVCWRIDGTRCRSILLAVRIGLRRKGLGRYLKDLLVDQAWEAGAREVVSHVHWDNAPMLAINMAMGANIERIPGDRDYCLCVLSLH